MKSPLQSDKDLVKELKIPPEVELHPRQKMAFLEAQLHELKSMHFRSRVDVLHSARLQESDIEALRLKGNTNMSEHKNAVTQSWGAILMIQKLIDELRQEYPDLGEIQDKEHPDGY